ncbi:MAG: anti-sigma factor antagonist [Coriobacteriia bacterium]
MSYAIDRYEELKAAVIHLDGDLDLATVPSVRTVLDSLVDTGFIRMVLDLTNVDYVDSSALGLLVWLDRSLQTRGGKIVLAAPNRNVRRVLEISRILSVASSMHEEKSVEAALAAIEPEHGGAVEEWVEEIVMPADAGHLAATRDRVSAIIEPLGFSSAALFDVKVALGEALANAVRHGSAGADGHISIRVHAFGDKVMLEIEDAGTGFDGDHVCSDDLYASSGRGIMFMRALMDRVEFASSHSGGTLVTLVKHRAPTEPAA